MNSKEGGGTKARNRGKKKKKKRKDTEILKKNMSDRNRGIYILFPKCVISTTRAFSEVTHIGDRLSFWTCVY